MDEFELQGDQVADEHLVTMIKGDESIGVHPTCVADHEKLGWKIK